MHAKKLFILHFEGKIVNLKALNPEQRKAVEYNDGPAMVVAGAGSGKTRVLTYKIAYLIDTGLFAGKHFSSNIYK